MRTVFALALALLTAAVPRAGQTAGPSLGPKLPPIQHVTVIATASTTELSVDAPVMLLVDVTPKPGVHVYAPGAADLTPVAMGRTPMSGIRFGRAKYPKPGEVPALTAPDSAPAYYGPFRIEQPINL